MSVCVKERERDRERECVYAACCRQHFNWGMVVGIANTPPLKIDFIPPLSPVGGSVLYCTCACI